jgi:hypothetical protein
MVYEFLIIKINVNRCLEHRRSQSLVDVPGSFFGDHSRCILHNVQLGGFEGAPGVGVVSGQVNEVVSKVPVKPDRQP